ncbi:MAG: clostripain-related cysteine peptidase [Candidatus Babeliales bacterium]|nr:clostripain-related cysteine peptidase [Candidatus Babeliales bacterium]
MAMEKRTIGVVRYLCFLLLSSPILAYDQITPDFQELDEISALQPEQDGAYRSGKKSRQKEWTFIVYIAADNDLRGFAARNIKQMAEVGSNDNLNIVAHLDIKITGNKKITRRYYIEPNKILHVNSDDAASQKMDSGDPKTLVSCCKWAIENYPAKNYALILWNHGTGPIDPETNRIVNPSALWSLNPTNNKLELDRTITFLDFINDIHNHKEYNPTNEACLDDPEKGICWDDSTGNYLNNQKLDAALGEISRTLLGGGKLSILGFDACLMATIEIADIAKRHAHVMVSSQEVELGAGWNYTKVLTPFKTGSLNQESFAKHIVEAYHEEYSKITNDYTHSAMNLADTDKLANNINQVAGLLIECLKNQKNNSVKNAIQASKNRQLCTHFDEPSYIDLHHFYSNLLANLKHFVLSSNDQNKQSLAQALQEGQGLIKKFVIANRAGKNLSLAQGVSIYFPDRRIHPSYRKTLFASQNKWFSFLTQYLSV